MMSDTEYRRYCSLWDKYLKMGENRNALQPYARYRVIRWPTNWPEVEVLFGSVEEFVKAMESVLPRLPPEPKLRFPLDPAPEAQP